MNLSRRQVLALLSATTATAVVGVAEAKESPDPYDDSKHTDTRHCPFCGELLGSKTAHGYMSFARCTLPALIFCRNGCQPVTHSFVRILDDMLHHTWKVGGDYGYRIRVDDKPKKLLIAWTASESRAVATAVTIGSRIYLPELPRRGDTRFWNIPISRLVRRAEALTLNESVRPDLYVDILEKGQLLMTNAGRQEIADRIVDRALKAKDYLELFPHRRAHHERAQRAYELGLRPEPPRT